MPTPVMHKLAYPIETKEAYKFWGSRHLCNRVKAIIAFSHTLEDANNNLRRNGFQTHFRKRAINAWQHYVNMPEMDKVPFTPLGMDWWDCMPHDPTPPPSGRWVKWNDVEKWMDPEKWIEWEPFVKESEEKGGDE